MPLMNIEDCEIGNKCNISGELEIYVGSSGGMGSLKKDSDCTALALPMFILDDKVKWENKKVRVSGEVFAQHYDPMIISFMLKDRSVAVGICNSDKIIYVDMIKKYEK